jgi:hypothetical protein
MQTVWPPIDPPPSTIAMIREEEVEQPFDPETNCGISRINAVSSTKDFSRESAQGKASYPARSEWAPHALSRARPTLAGGVRVTQINATEYAKLLSALEKEEFEEEICAFLGTFIADFQRIPAKPRGDAGLDGLSHGQTHAYCCYGPEQEPWKKNLKGLKDDILEKFRSDLRKLFELEFDKNKKLIRNVNAEMATILAPGRKLTNVYLVVSWFETHRIIGPLNKSFAEYKAVSSCAYIDSAAQPTIWGPRDLATRWVVDELALFRVENQALVAKVKKALASGVAPPVPDKFDAKFEYLRTKSPENKAVTDALADHFRQSWSGALALDNELAATSVVLHEALEIARTQTTIAAYIQSQLKSEPMELLEHMRNEVKSKLGEVFGERLGVLSPKVADGEIARLIGECPINWSKEVA